VTPVPGVAPGRSRWEHRAGQGNVYISRALALVIAKHAYGQREIDMNADIFSGKWKQMRGQVKVAWGNLTDDDLDKVNGEYDKFVGLLQEKYGYTRERAEQEVDRHFTPHETMPPVKK
jgi:uncharacterized protein YjbJ (UPF0337 family)